MPASQGLREGARRVSEPADDAPPPAAAAGGDTRGAPAGASVRDRAPKEANSTGKNSERAALIGNGLTCMSRDTEGQDTTVDDHAASVPSQAI